MVVDVTRRVPASSTWRAVHRFGTLQTDAPDKNGGFAPELQAFKWHPA